MTRRADAEAIRASARELTGSRRDFDALLDLAGNARFVLIGEASHGTHEFYRERAELTKRLIAEKGFNAVAVEADWPDAYRINRFVQARSDDREPVDALGDFKRFPTWMWRNADVLDFIGWLREFNESRGAGQRAGFYGVDLYSLFTSIEAVVQYLDRVDPDAAQRARARYACFEHFHEDSQMYGYATTFGISESCENEVVEQLVELLRKPSTDPDDAFFAQQNARLVANAERYYRSMFSGRASSWNLRDTHMADTIDALSSHIPDARIVVWEHNSHLGDARATEMSREGEINVGELMRERHGNDVRLIGFSTYTGTVTAATDWDGPAERKKVRPALDDSYEQLFHDTGIECFWLSMRERDRAVEALRRERLERAIGVIYAPETERMSHYFYASLPMQFDAVLHFDTTRAVEPLERWPLEHTTEAPETFPSAV